VKCKSTTGHFILPKFPAHPRYPYQLVFIYRSNLRTISPSNLLSLMIACNDSEITPHRDNCPNAVFSRSPGGDRFSWICRDICLRPLHDSSELKLRLIRSISIS
jgi:hypothetical protein